jgi:hypothetical protein
VEHRWVATILNASRQAYDRMIGLNLKDLAVDGCITKAACGGEVAGRSPVDRGKRGWKRSMATKAGEIPLGWVVAAANAHDSPLLGPTLDMLDNVGPLPDLGRLPLVGGGAVDLLAALGLAEGGAAEEREAGGSDVRQWQARMAYRAWRVEG